MTETNITAKASNILGDMAGIDVPQTEIERSLQELQHGKTWMHYDQESDSVSMYLTGQPVGGVKVQMGQDHHVIIDPRTQRVVGFYLENVVRPDER